MERQFRSLDGTISKAIYSDCGNYRYSLSRHWDYRTPSLGIIMLNPSTATEEVNDPTIERIQRRAMGRYGGFIVRNLFAFRATDPVDMKRAEDPIGELNNKYLSEMLETFKDRPEDLICGWGVHGTFKSRDKTVLSMFSAFGIKPRALNWTKDGHPMHPLYISYETQPKEYAR